MIAKSIAAALLVSATASPVLADWYVVQDPETRRCTVIDRQPSPSVRTEVTVGPNGTVYKTREEALTRMRTIKVCEDEGGPAEPDDVPPPPLPPR